MSLKITFWGVRGSLPFSLSPRELRDNIMSLLQELLREPTLGTKDISRYFRSEGVRRIAGYGTATTCVQVESAKSSILIDAGTGICSLKKEHLASFQKGKQLVIPIFLSHFHWDHLMGLLNFDAIHDEKVVLQFYSADPEAEKLIQSAFNAPWVTFPMHQWKCRWVFHTLKPREPFQFQDLTITPYLLDHPDTCWGFKISNGKKTYAHCSDTEATRVTPASLGPDLPLYQNIDLLYFDGQYDLKQLAERIDWGHCAPQIGLDLALREGIKHVLFSHHDPNSDCHAINHLIQQTQEYLNWRKTEALKTGEILGEILWDFALEGQSITL